MMAHGGRPRREDGEIASARALKLELVGLDGLADLIVRNRRRCSGRGGRLLEACELGIAEALMGRRRRGVVAVTVDDHAIFLCVNGMARRSSSSRGLSSPRETPGACADRKSVV